MDSSKKKRKSTRKKKKKRKKSSTPTSTTPPPPSSSTTRPSSPPHSHSHSHKHKHKSKPPPSSTLPIQPHTLTFSISAGPGGDAAGANTTPDSLDPGYAPRSSSPSPSHPSHPSHPTPQTHSSVAPATHGVLARTAASGFSNDNLTSPLSLDYDAVRKAARFLPDGSGFVYYPSGNLAVTLAVESGVRIRRTVLVYEDVHPSGGVVLASFSAQKNGSVAWSPAGSNGIRLLTSPTGIEVFDRSGKPALVSAWSTLSAPVELEANAYVSFAFQSQDTQLLAFRAESIVIDLNVGSGSPSSSHSYLDRAIGRDTNGKLQFDIPPTPLSKLAAPKRRSRPQPAPPSPLPPIQSSSTPSRSTRSARSSRSSRSTRSSRSSRSTRSTHSSPAASPIAQLITAFDRMLPSPSLPARRSSPLRTPSRIRTSSPSPSPSSARARAGPRTGAHPGARSPSRYRTAPPLRRRHTQLRARSYDMFLRSKVPEDCLAVVLVTSSSSSLASNILSDMEEAYAEQVMAAGAPQFVPWLLATIDFDKAEAKSFLSTRHDVSTVPTFLMYYNARLVFASTSLNHVPTYTRDAFLSQVDSALHDGSASRFLASDHKIELTPQQRQVLSLESSLRSLLRQTRHNIQSLPQPNAIHRRRSTSKLSTSKRPTSNRPTPNRPRSHKRP